MKSISPFRRAPRVVKRARRTQAGRHQGYEVGHVFEHVVGDNCLERVRSRDHFAEPPTRDAEAIVIELDRTQVENESLGSSWRRGRRSGNRRENPCPTRD